MISELMIGVRNTFILWVITAIFYPALLLIIGQVAFPYQANGSLITNAQGEIVGSALIGQSFTSERYFWSRPSTINYSQGEDSAPTGISGASNLAPSNPDLITRIQQEKTRLQQAGIQPTADLVYTSGSGLDPHITPEAAQVQVARVAQARSISTEEIQELIVQNTDKRFLGIFGEPGVNVLKLNLALNQLS
ncbi:K(+)-transporting ATPase subunit C [Limnoraphis robusta Tam1]|uniref:K(+)-transporting ATPase subunit C n=1 Tax=Limnoraphis robusta TaxID=1118279 RepID=UPI002B1FEBEE|nr:K(+)-transporting ATPase subunit C [Limnoraphis robusta]MEA5498750.1 K(+)-transporting ATPase subunit C [Limnoraphis robusta BA-68 BA1]MEA5542890.1 K(+)-transporting ATPase subunit C [Limnoraphis robusta Tam1]